MKVSLFKVTADGEQLNCEVQLTKNHFDELGKGKTLREILGYMFDLVDQRLLEMNVRIMAANALTKKLPVEAQMAVNNVIETLHGRSNTPPQDILNQAKKEYEEALAKQAEEGNGETPTAKIHKLESKLVDLKDVVA